MENHPIPQDVTGFKFKLIGSVTIKQFLYLVVGGVMAVLLIFVFPGTIFIRAPLALFFAGFAAMLAFIPIDGRPMDKMVINFLKAIPQENMYMYHKQGVNLAAYEMFKPPAPVVVRPQNAGPTQDDKRKQLLFSRLGANTLQPDPQEEALLANVQSLFANGTSLTPIAPPTQIANQPAVQQVTPQKIQVVLPPAPEKKAEPQSVQAPIQAPPPIPQPPVQVQTEPVAPPPPPVDPQIVIQLPQMPGAAQEAIQKANQDINNIQASANKRVEESKKEKELLENRVKELEKQKQQQKTVAPVTDNSAPPPEKVKTIAQAESQFKAGFPSLPDVPNVILGIIRDPRGRVIPNILVEIVDGNNIPVRAFKTNQLGQFASATPLPAGTYKLYLEDPQKRHEFDTIEITLNNQIFQPLEIVSIDEREKLRQGLFGK